MKKLKIYRFRTYDIQSDEIRTSRRWGTREAIVNIAHGEILEDTEMEVEAKLVQSDITGMTGRDFSPERTTGF